MPFFSLSLSHFIICAWFLLVLLSVLFFHLEKKCRRLLLASFLILRLIFRIYIHLHVFYGNKSTLPKTDRMPILNVWIKYKIKTKRRAAIYKNKVIRIQLMEWHLHLSKHIATIWSVFIKLLLENLKCEMWLIGIFVCKWPKCRPDFNSQASHTHVNGLLYSYAAFVLILCSFFLSFISLRIFCVNDIVKLMMALQIEHYLSIDTF